MILLTSASDLIQVITASAVDSMRVHASWVDNVSGTITPGRTNTSITGAATTTVVGSPASGQRNVQTLSVRNIHASSSNEITIQHYDGTTTIILWKGTLLASESVQFIDGDGWIRLNSAGTRVTSGLTASNVQSQTTAGAGVWTKPTDFTPNFVEVVAWGGGGGGGAGASLVAVSTGGAGGGGGACTRMKLRASDLGTTVGFVVGAGGNAGAPGAAGAIGGDGGIGGQTTFDTTKVIAGGGGGGRGGAIAGTAGGGGGGGGCAASGATGTTAFGVGGGPGTSAITVANPSMAGAGGPITVITTHNGYFGGGGGGGHTATPASCVGGSSRYGGGGGGDGGGWQDDGRGAGR